jgi:hypothetical protein
MNVLCGDVFQERPILSRVESASAAEVGDSPGHFTGCRNQHWLLRETRLALPRGRVSQ